MITRSCTNLMIKAYRNTDTNKSKTSGLHLYTLLNHQTLSVIGQVGLCEAPESDVPVKLRTCVRNSQYSYFCPCLLYPRYPKFSPPKWRVLH